MSRSLLPVLVVLPLLAACSSGGGGAGGNGGATTGTTTTTMDAGVVVDAAGDALVDAPADAPDVPMDAPDDGPMDAMPDAPACKLAKPYSSLDADCNACAEASCCDEVNACLLDADCDDGYVNCAIVCALEATDAGTEPACLDDCAQQYPKGAMEYDAAIGCVDTACMIECQ